MTTSFLISANNTTSEWMNNFEEVQNKMNLLEKEGVVSNVKVQKFVNSILEKEIVYNYNGENWEK